MAKQPTRFDKISKFIIEKSSPTEEPMAVEDEADAEAQEGKKEKLRNVDLSGKKFK